MAHWDDDDALMEALKAATAEEKAVSRRSREAALAAFAWRNVDQELMTLLHDSDLSAGAVVRGPDVADRRLLAFGGRELRLEVEHEGGRLVGQVLPQGPCTVAVTSVDGSRIEAEGDESGYFTMDGVPAGVVRFEVTLSGSTRVSEWVTL